ncbi:activating transcription factor 7-interacting protein 1 [Frieseomelitta varia]|uniref:activating transcription factor 7-interacting protein 1 n=1 Tax=Frieseomelitta varia TaxID=561572 RepID=UPI001CB6A5CD|nr:activating transcription factor 7-interacting protein 1 [Frieseomelitta varia]XP_043525713.1 activating transcription factor 7-interacting protein 1 [Frieseomelitta varia]
MDIRNDLLHSSDSVHSLSCINTHNIDELSKEKEEELLYGTGDDGDEEDALSDDSMRLRLSDDEIETEDILTPTLNNQENTSKINEIEMTSTKSDMEILSIQENNKIKKNADVKKEEQCLDNDSMDDKILIDYEKIVKKGENEETKKSETVHVSVPWQSYQSQYRYSRSPNNHSFRGINQRFRYMTPRGRRSHSYDYNLRFYGGFPFFERGRSNGMFHSYRSIHGGRYQKKGFRSNTTQKQNRSIECDQNSTSSLKKSISSKSQDSDIEIININDNKTIDEANTLCSEPLINSKNDHSNEPLNEEIENIPAKNIKEKSVVNTHSANNSLELKHNLEENSEIISSNDTKCKDVTVHALSDNFSENSANNSYDDNNSNQENEISKNDINNTNSFSDFCISDNSKNVEALNINKKCELDKDETIKHTEEKSNQEQNKSINNEEDKTVETIDTNENKEIKEIYKLKEQEHNKNEELTNLSQKIESGNNCRITVLNSLKEKETANNDTVLNEKDKDHKREEIFKNKKEEILFENIKLKENHENSNSKSATVLNDVINDKNVNVSEKPFIESENCDNQLKGSDNSTNSSKSNKSNASENQLTHSKIDLWKQNKDITEKDMNFTKKENSIVTSTSKTNENTELMLNKNNSSSIELKNDLLGFVTDTKNNDDDKRSVKVPVTTQKRRRRSKKEILAAQEAICEEEKQVRESGRQKRQTAKNAEEIIRKKFLTFDSEVESSDDSEKFVAVNYKMNQDARPLSPPSLKRIYSDNTDNPIINGGVKKIKTNFEEQCDESRENNSENIKKLKYIHKFFQRDLNEKLPKLKQEELEELLIQKIVETITMRDEIGKLREQARISEKNQEVTRAKCQQLAKQIKDFEMVLSRNAADRRANNEKSIPPIKINRSVGLQVNFITDHGMQNLRQLQQNSNMKSLNVSSSNNTLSTSINETNNASSPRRGIKIRSPRRTEPIIGQTSGVSQNPTQSPNIMTTITPAALVVAKPVDTQHPLTLSNQSNVQQIMSNPQVQSQQPQQAIVLNGKFSNQINRQGTTTTNITKSHANDLIDLTDEEEKNRTTGIPVVTTTVTDQQVNLTQKTQQPCFQRVIQTIPGNVAITSQPPSIRVVQPASQPTPTALVNNMNAPRLAYVMQSGVGPTRQLLIAPNSSPMRPVTSCRASFPTLTYKTGISTIANGTVRVLTTPATANVQLNKHPAPLPDIRNYAVNSLWKLPPPAPSLKISKVAHGIVLSWNMNLSDKHADIVSYQLYAYQEIAGVPPNTSLWKKVGDVRALPLPMACTLTQFSEGNNYYFAVRAVDTHSRKGQYSIPGNISL